MRQTGGAWASKSSPPRSRRRGTPGERTEGAEGEPAQERLVVEVWNENSMVDDLIGSVEMPILGNDQLNKPAKSKFYSLDTGGELGLQISLTNR